MNMKKLVSLILSGILVAGAMTLASCGDKTKDEKGGFDKGDETGLVLPEIDAGGETFDIYLGYGVFNADYIAEEETGDTINDIIYNRNNLVEDRFNIEFEIRRGDTANNTASPNIRALIQGGDDTYEIFVNVQHAGVPLIYEDLFVEWGENMPYANLSNPWWYQNVQRDLNFGGKVYVTAGAYNFHCLKSAGGLAFNKTLMDELGLEYPYDIVHEGKWTVDKLIEYNKAAQKDLNGDGIIDYEHDRLGLSGWDWENTPALFIGMGGEPVKKDDDNLPALNINNERTFNCLKKWL